MLQKINWLKLKYKLLVALLPWHWLRNHDTDLEWDKELWGLLDRGEIEYVGTHYAIIGPHKVWISNYPYASGCLEGEGGNGHGAMCSRSTAMYLERQLPAARIIQRLKGLELGHDTIFGVYYKSKNGQYVI